MLTVRDVVAMAELQRGSPRVVAASEALDSPVRWVHVSELVDLSSLLRGGELILTTGLGLTAEAALLRRYVDRLVRAGASGLVIELGHRFAELPADLVDAAERSQLPLVALQQEVRFVDVTQAVHSRIVGAQLDELRRSEEVHRTFTQLSVEGAEPEAILQRAAALVKRAVVFENLSHQALAVGGAGRPVREILHDWEHRSRSVRPRQRTWYDAEAAMLVTDVGARGVTWGRLVLLTDREPEPLEVMVLERAAVALTLYRLIDDRSGSHELHAHSSLLDDLMERSYSSVGDVTARAQALGVPVVDRVLVGVSVRFPNADPLTMRRNGESIARAARRTGVPALVGGSGADDVKVLLSLPDTEAVDDRLEALARHVHDTTSGADPTSGVVIGVGAPATELTAAAASLHEAGQVAEGAEAVPERRPYHTMQHIRVRGLVHLLRDDPRLQTFVERELGPLLQHDREHGTQLTAALAAYLEHGANKSATADALHLSRPAFYQRLARISEVLDVPLRTVESRLSLHLALLGLASIRRAADDRPFGGR